MIDLSFITPSIRTHLWDEYYASIEKACKKYTWEVVFISPFKTDFSRPNAKVIHSYASPSVCFSMGVDQSEGELILNSVDDSLYLEDTIDECIAIAKTNIDCIVNARYAESKGRTNKEEQLSYWKAYTHPSLRMPGVPQYFDISLHWMMNKQVYNSVGCVDPEFNYVNFGTHDFIFRCQSLGLKVIDSPHTCSLADHEHTDHGPIEIADSIDYRKYTDIYKDPNALAVRNKLRFNDLWKSYPPVWKVRFSKDTLPTKHSDL